MEKERLDILLVNRGLFPSREKARSAIMAGLISVEGEREDKPGSRFPVDSSIEIKENVNPYVSRGGLKLEKAIHTFGIDLNEKTAMDIGASTGGFTHCMLLQGAKRVFAVDVGYGQLAWELRNDPRVVCMERTNIRYVTLAQIGEPIDFTSVDVSFISLKKVLPVVMLLLQPRGEAVCLIKPQFEAGRDKVGKHGVVRDAEVHKQVCIDIMQFAADLGFGIAGLSFSPIKGPEGNIEYLLYLHKDALGIEAVDQSALAAQVVTESHSSL